MDLDEIVTDFVNYLALISVEVCTRWSKVELLVYIQAPFELVAVTFKYFEICGIDIRLCKSQLGRVCTSLLEIVDETSDYGVSKACYLGWGALRFTRGDWGPSRGPVERTAKKALACRRRVVLTKSY